MTRRIERLNKAIQQEISRLLEKDINDPRLSSLISITAVSLSEDLRHVKVYVSTIGDEADRTQVLKGFEAASGFIKKEVATNLRMRYAPDFTFTYDDSIERGNAVLQIIQDAIGQE
ncbi:MAG: 30S ribosome-binding factor RbfA [Dehalococcoidia bacterium]|nr:30S ribosome-binding factor RbfA [Dehalococcoidia bacterium]